MTLHSWWKQKAGNPAFLCVSGASSKRQNYLHRILIGKTGTVFLYLFIYIF